MQWKGGLGAVLVVIGLIGSGWNARAPLSGFIAAQARGAVIEGTVAIPQPKSKAALPRYPNQTIQPGPPEPRKAAVYLVGDFPPGAAAKPATMGQKELQFDPGLLVIRRGTSVAFPNLDDLYHNVFSYSKAKRFDLGRYRRDEKPAVQTFDRAGVVRLSCEIHEHMDGVILVVDTPYFQKTEADGSYRLEGLPSGKFVLTAWLSEKQVFERPVELAPGATLRVDFPAK
jgi:plastocyanin